MQGPKWKFCTRCHVHERFRGVSFSSMAGERSGNRGTCAQPCRKRMAFGKKPGEADYALSLSDLCMLSHVQELADAGVCCIKLEGRMKRPEYVAAATRAYRAALDGADAQTLASLKRDLFSVFNRGGERTGYYYGDGGITGCVAKAEPDEALLKNCRRPMLRMCGSARFGCSPFCSRGNPQS